MQLSTLGQPTIYAEHYDPKLLFPVARQEKRAELGLSGDSLPFCGEDLWNAYEISWLNPKGKPHVALGQFRVPADTPFLIESKSLKLYLNSFNQTVFSSLHEVEQCISRDLSAVSGGAVGVQISAVGDVPQRLLGGFTGELLDSLDIEFSHFSSPQPSLLRIRNALGDTQEGDVAETLYSHLLKSNCLVTGQPDWASIVIQYEGKPIEREGLLRYLVSFRQHNEFHEQCVERVFTDISRHCSPYRLSVWARYTRRGGLDINPWRSSEPGFGNPPTVFDVRQ